MGGLFGGDFVTKYSWGFEDVNMKERIEGKLEIVLPQDKDFRHFWHPRNISGGWYIEGQYLKQ